MADARIKGNLRGVTPVELAERLDVVTLWRAYEIARDADQCRSISFGPHRQRCGLHAGHDGSHTTGRPAGAWITTMGQGLEICPDDDQCLCCESERCVCGETYCPCGWETL